MGMIFNVLRYLNLFINHLVKSNDMMIVNLPNIYIYIYNIIFSNPIGVNVLKLMCFFHGIVFSTY
jgi:hypothetical protein